MDTSYRCIPFESPYCTPMGAPAGGRMWCTTATIERPGTTGKRGIYGRNSKATLGTDMVLRIALNLPNVLALL